MKKIEKRTLDLLNIAPLLAVGVLGVLIWSGNTVAADDDKGKPKNKDGAAPLPKENAKPVVEEKDEEWKAEIRRQLSRKVSLEFENTPLAEVLDFLRALTKVNFVLAPKVAAGGKDETPITLRVKDLEMEVALQRIFTLAELYYDLRNQAVFIFDDANEGVCP